MKNLLAFLTVSGASGLTIVAIRQAIKSYRARKSIGNIIADTTEAVIDEIDHKKD